MEDNSQTEDPFSSDWEWLGFNGKPSPGFDYSWFEVQNFLCLIGFNSYIQNCKLFSSSRNSQIFMIRTQDDIEEIWDISDITFSYLSPDVSILVASYDNKCVHISNVSTSFIELLIKAHKLPFNLLSKNVPFTPMQFKVKTIASNISIPESSSKIDS